MLFFILTRIMIKVAPRIFWCIGIDQGPTKMGTQLSREEVESEENLYSKLEEASNNAKGSIQEMSCSKEGEKRSLDRLTLV